MPFAERKGTHAEARVGREETKGRKFLRIVWGFLGKESDLPVYSAHPAADALEAFLLQLSTVHGTATQHSDAHGIVLLSHLQPLVSLGLIHREKVDRVYIFRLGSLCWELFSDTLKVTACLEPEQEFKIRAILAVCTFSVFLHGRTRFDCSRVLYSIESTIDCV